MSIEGFYKEHYTAIRRNLMGKPSRNTKEEILPLKIGSDDWFAMDQDRRNKKEEDLRSRRTDVIKGAIEKYGHTPMSENIAIIHRVAAKHGFKYADIIGPSRIRKIVIARTEAIQKVKKHSPNKSLPELGRMFGGRDHTTILHALRKPETYYLYPWEEFKTNSVQPVSSCDSENGQ